MFVCVCVCVYMCVECVCVVCVRSGSTTKRSACVGAWKGTEEFPVHCPPRQFTPTCDSPGGHGGPWKGPLIHVKVAYCFKWEVTAGFILLES